MAPRSKEAMFAELESIYAELGGQLGETPHLNPCGSCKACCTAQNRSQHRVTPLEMEYLEARLGPEVTGEFRRYVELERGANDELVYEVCPNYGEGGCRIYAHRPFSCRVFGHFRAQGTQLPENCVFEGHSREFNRPQYAAQVPGAERLNRLTLELRTLQPSVAAPPSRSAELLARLERRVVRADRDPLDQAMQDITQGKREAALQRMEEARQRYGPDSAYALFNLGLLYAMLKEPASALESFRAAVQLSPTRADFLYYAGSQALLQGLQEEGMEFLWRSVQADAQYAPAHALLGTELARRGQLLQAVALLRRAAELQPDKGVHLLQLGGALAAQGLFAEAREELEKAARMPDSARAAQALLLEMQKPPG